MPDLWDADLRDADADADEHKQTDIDTDLFDAESMYDDDYLHFFAAPPGAVDQFTGGGPLDSDADVEVIRRLARLEPGLDVLDLCCGHGRIANRLALLGCRVVGLDRSQIFLERARADAAALGAELSYLTGDMRDLPWTGRFDVIVNWATAFGYFEDDANRRVLAEAFRALRPGGRLIMDLNNLFARVHSYTPSRIVAAREGGDLLVDRNHFDPVTGRWEVERAVVRAGHARRVRFVVRLFGFPELRDWLLAAGFGEVTAHGEDGAGLSAEHRRMIVVAHRPGTVPQ